MAFELSAKCRANLFLIARDFLTLRYSESLDVVDELLRNLGEINSGRAALPSTFCLGIVHGCILGLEPVPRRVAQLREQNNPHPHVPRFFSRVAHEVCQRRVEGFVYTRQDNEHQQCSWDYGEYHLTAFTQRSAGDQEVWLWFLRVESDLCGALLDSIAGARDSAAGVPGGSLV
jgi:hypothetical protein